MTQAIFLTLQKGERIICWRLRPALLASLAGACLAGLALLPYPDAPTDPQTFNQAKRRIAALQAELERATSQQALSADLLNGRLQEAQKRLARLEGQAQILAQFNPNRPPALRLRNLEEAMERHERGQVHELIAWGELYQSDIARVESALSEAGMSLPPDNDLEPAQGGPFIPLDHALSGPFARAYEKTAPLLARHAALQAHLPSLPLRAPFAGKMEVSSGFGARTDPFHGRAAWHSGIDLRSDTGSDVFATAAGVVTAAGWNGAYGLALDIDHGNGLSTRYAHLSRIFMREGDQVKAEERIALSGASGRTKGAHLHYEVRIQGEATNPLRMLKAGAKLGDLLNAASRPRDDAQ